MLPALWSGDSVSVHHASLADVRPGEVVVFARNGHLVTHRVVSRTSGADGVVIVTRGDAQRADDTPVGASEMLGVVTGFHRFGADRPMRRQPPLMARSLAWMIQRSPAIRSFLDRLRSRLPRYALSR